MSAHCRCPSITPGAKLALTRRLAAAAEGLRGAPMVHDLAAAAEDLLRDPARLEGAIDEGARPSSHGADHVPVPTWRCIAVDHDVIRRQSKYTMQPK